MTNRLFWRIFLWFWLSMMVVVAALIMLSPLLTRTQPRLKVWEQHAEGWVRRRVEIETENVRRSQLGQHEGPQMPCVRPRRHHKHEPPTQIFILDAKGSAIGPDPAPPEVRGLALKALHDDEEMSQRRGLAHLYARPTEDASGRQYVVVGLLQEPPVLTDLLDARFLVPRLALLGLIGGIFIFWLARHLSGPIAALRSATQALAAGKLETRVEPGFTRRKDEIGGLARDFNTMAERVGVLLDSRTRLLRDVSHELRSPLARLSVALGLARRQQGDKALDRIEIEIDRMEDLISRLLEYEKLDAPLQLQENVELKALIEDIVEDARFEFDSDPFVLRLQPLELPGNRRLLASAIENIIRNALAFSPEAGRVEITLKRDGGEAVFRISDEGPGIPDQDLESIFEAFYRVEEARERSRGGAGLGLAIARRAVEGHGGTIQARNRPGEGLEIEIRLPIGSPAPGNSGKTQDVEGASSSSV